MAIIKTIGPFTLEGLDEEVIFGPGYNDVNLSDANTVYVQAFTPTTSTWTITFQTSLDGENWVSLNVTPSTGSFGSSFSTAAISFSQLFSCSTANRPYMKIKMTSYTSGDLTLTAVASASFSVSK
jgi:hypothetical protein